MEAPLGFTLTEEDYVCLLLKNLYGLKQAAKTWFEHLWNTSILDESEGGLGFTQIRIDLCIFFKDGVTVITWVEDCLIFAQEKD